MSFEENILFFIRWKDNEISSKKGSGFVLLDHLSSQKNTSIFVLDEEETIVGVNELLEIMTGYEFEELVGQTLDILHINQANKIVYSNALKQAKEKGTLEHKAWFSTKTGDTFFAKQTIFYVVNKEGVGYYYTFLYHEEEYIIEEQDKDFLTKFLNARTFEVIGKKRLKEAEKNGEEIAVVFLNLLRFKNIIRTFGVKAGEDTLFEMAKRLKDMFGEHIIASRYSSDTFMFLLEDANSKEKIEEKLSILIKQARKTPFCYKKNEFYLSLSFGVSIFPHDSTSLKELMQFSAQAEAIAEEEESIDIFFYESSLNEKNQKEIRLETALRNAIRNEEFELFYQPKVEVVSGEIHSFESLIRWKHPEKGYISPGEFIPLAEETGMIIPIGEWVLREACLQQQKWIEEGYKPVKVTVNLSVIEFQRDDLVEMVQDTIQETGIDPRYLELEITESMVIEDINHTIDTLERLNQLGVKISIDDFGTGYSSLSYLTKLPISGLKIDRSFITHIKTEKEDATIVSVIIHLANKLELEVTAEGVETIEQLNILKKENCAIYQGYYFSKPINAEETATKFLKKQ